RNASWQTCRHSQLLIRPLPAVSGSRVDYFGNPVAFFTVQEPHQRLSVTAVTLAQVVPPEPPEAARTPPWEAVRDALKTDRSAANLEAYQFAFDSPYVKADAELTAYAAPSFPAGRPLVEGVLD